jgi:hypothetical protein
MSPVFRLQEDSRHLKVVVQAQVGELKPVLVLMLISGLRLAPVVVLV